MGLPHRQGARRLRHLPPPVRIAISGSHATGKSTLLAALGARLPGYECLDEPWHDLVSEGTGFGTDPSMDDIEQQLERSIAVMGTISAADALIDRCPVDYLAYLRALDPGADVAPWMDRVARCLEGIDLLVYVPVESPDRIEVPRAERPGLRARVDRILRAVLLDDAWALGCRALEVTGPVEQRVELVLRHLSCAPA